MFGARLGRSAQAKSAWSPLCSMDPNLSVPKNKKDRPEGAGGGKETSKRNGCCLLKLSTSH